MTRLIVVLILLLIILAVSLYASYRLYRQQKEEIARLKNDLKSQKKYMDILLKHAKELKAIHLDKEKIDAEIEGADNEEKIMAIINSIIANNNKLCNDAEN